MIKARARLIWFLIAAYLFSSPVLGQEASTSEGTSESEGDQEYKPIYSEDAMSMGGPTPRSMAFQADRSLKAGNYEKAIQLLKKSLAMDPDDIESHVMYAQALEKKYKNQDEKDPLLFNKCVREWLIVMRNEVGEEKGLGFHGLTAPGLGTFYRDEDHNILAHQHLVKLTGSGPKGWESNAKYLKRVLQPTTTEVSGKVLKAKPKVPASPSKDLVGGYDEDSPEPPQNDKRAQKMLRERETDIEMDK